MLTTKILIVDDNREIIRIYTKSLNRKLNSQHENPLVEMDYVETVPLAIEKLHNQHFDILIVDLKIPGLSGEEWGGLDIIEKSIEINPLGIIIAVTGYASIDLARKTLYKGVFRFIEKSDTAKLELIEAVKEAIENRKTDIESAGNPFKPMSGQEPKVFGGRTRELKFIENKIFKAIKTNYCEHFLVLGEWGIGKSSLLKEYKKLCQSRGHIASIVNLEPFQSGTKLIDASRSIIEGILRSLPLEPNLLEKMIGFLQSVGITIAGCRITFNTDRSKKELNPQSFLHDFFVSLYKDLSDNFTAFKVLFILIDDIENCLAIPEILVLLKSTFSMESFKESKIILGIASPTLDWLELTSVQCRPQQHHPLTRFFYSQIKLEELSQEEVSTITNNSLLGTGVSFSPEVIKLIFKYTNGHPFEVQSLCYHLFNNQLSGRVDVDVWDKALQDTLNDMGGSIFEYWIRQLSCEETEIMRVIAPSKTDLSIKAIKEKLKSNETKISSDDIKKYLTKLLAMNMVLRKPGNLYAILDPMFCAYICMELV